MRHIIFSPNNTYPIAILIKQASFREDALRSNYVNPLVQLGINEADVIAFTLAYNQANKAPAGFMKEYLQGLLKALDSLGTKYLYCPDSNYFKALTGVIKVDSQYGYVLPCKIKGYEHMQVVLGINHSQLFYKPELSERLAYTLQTLANVVQGTYQDPGQGIIHSAEYLINIEDIKKAFQKLHQYPQLACDIEAYSLFFKEASIGTISFAWDQSNGVAMRGNFPTGSDLRADKKHWEEFTKCLREFFETYQGELIFHNASYDVKVLIYTLWMRHDRDVEMLLQGLDIMCARLHDTKIIAYLATNSTSGNSLSLKQLAQEFAGNWAVEVKDIRNVSLDKLLEYNLVDTLSTLYVFDKYVPIVEADNQGDLYRGLFLDSLKLIIQLELTGMPMKKSRILEVKEKLEEIQQEQWKVFQTHPYIQTLNLLLQRTAMETANAKLKVKQHPLEKFSDVTFNPNSGPQIQRLLYECMELPVIDKTDSGAPATGADTLEKLLNHTDVPEYKEIIEALITYGGVTKILSTFIPAFEKAIDPDSDIAWLHGSFNLGGTVSGRLSSSDPNLQNVPANSLYGKLIKTCFSAPDGWLFGGADFNSLEAMIDALTTKDPHKLAIYTQDYDSHSYNSITYWPEKMPEISNKIAQATSDCEYYLVEYSDGSKEYICEKKN